VAVDLLFGNSHTGTYLRGHHAAASKGAVQSDLIRLAFETERYQPIIEHTADGPRFHPLALADLRARIEDVQPTCLITAVLGSQHWIQGMAQHDRPFDVCVPELPQHPASAESEIVPYDLLVRRYDADIQWEFDLVRSVQTYSTLPIFHIEAPPPVADPDLMVRHVRQFAPAAERLRKNGLPPVSLRFKIWWLWTHLTKQWCDHLGLHFIAGPPETRDANGFLDERYFADGVHGSIEYGELMVKEVAKAKRRLGVGLTANF
jgi:hypothetical protein